MVYRRSLVAGVLEGIRILDFGRYIAGAFCAALLGDLGAEVIRIERISGGEDRGIIRRLRCLRSRSRVGRRPPLGFFPCTSLMRRVSEGLNYG